MSFEGRTPVLSASSAPSESYFSGEFWPCNTARLRVYTNLALIPLNDLTTLMSWVCASMWLDYLCTNGLRQPWRRSAVVGDDAGYGGAQAFRPAYRPSKSTISTASRLRAGWEVLAPYTTGNFEPAQEAAYRRHRACIYREMILLMSSLEQVSLF